MCRGNNSTVTGDSIRFGWANSFDVDPHDQLSFSLQYSNDNTFTKDVIEFKKLTDTTITIETNHLNQVIYYWRVKAVDSDNLITWGSDSEASPWSFQFSATKISEETRTR